MADNFGLKIGVEGEKEFKKALSDINQSFKVLGSEMKLVSSQFDKNDKSVQVLWFNGIVRSEEAVILLNLGGTSAGLDIHLYPKQYMEGGSVTLAQGVGGQKATFPNAMNAGDDVALLASTRECTRNGAKETKDGFYQYSAAWDSKHIVSLPQGKSAHFYIRCRKWTMEVCLCNFAKKTLQKILTSTLGISIIKLCQ